MKRKALFVITLFFITHISISQTHKCFKEIDTQIWSNFSTAFKTFDAELFASFHSEDFTRVSGNSKSIRDKQAYIDRYKAIWNTSQEPQSISFRFLERICNDKKASERGIYRFTRYPGTDKEKSYYGQFHVIMVKENDQWKLLVDYDSNENQTINDNSYNNAYAMSDYEKYNKKAN